MGNRASRTIHFVLLFASASACGGGAAPGETTASGDATAGGEGEEEKLPSIATVPEGPPQQAEVAAGQATAQPSQEAVALSSVTSVAEVDDKRRDAVKASPDIYKIVVQSTRMRLLVATWQPGQSDEPHGHPPLVVYALDDLEGITTGDTGKQKRVKLKAGASFYQNPVKQHTFKNVGNKPARMLILELNQRVYPMPMPDEPAPDAMAASPEVYERVFEDEHVRVLHATWEPGKMDEAHSHPELAAYALTEINGRLHDHDGTTSDLTRPAGGAVFQDPVKSHVYENIGETETRMVLFEPKGGAARAAAADPQSRARLPRERGDSDVTAYIDVLTGAKLELRGGYTLEIPQGVDFSNVVTFSKVDDRPKNAQIAEGFSRHGETLAFDGMEETLLKQAVLGTPIRRLPVKEGYRFVLAMEVAGACKGAARRYRLMGGGCSHWEIVPTFFDEVNKRVVARLGSTGGHRLQFGWLPE